MFNSNILGELKSKQKATGRYVRQGSSSTSAGEDTTSVVHGYAQAGSPDAPPIPRRPKIDPAEAVGSATATPSIPAPPAAPPPPTKRSGESSIPAPVPQVPEPSENVPPPPPKAPGKKAAAKVVAQMQRRVSGEHQEVPPPPPPPPAAQDVEVKDDVDDEQAAGSLTGAADEEPITAELALPKRQKRNIIPNDAPTFEEWETYYAEGEPYFVNRKTGETTWDKPAALISGAEIEALSGDFVWVAHENLAWVPAKIIDRTSDKEMTVREMPQQAPSSVEPRERRRVKGKEIGPEIESTQTLTNLTHDLVQLDVVHEPAIIDLLRRRYAVDKIYTNVGDILVAVNPFKQTDLFNPSMMQKYSETGREAMELAPHPYSVINGAYRAMIEDQKDQSLLISGESGAGKTVTVKVCLEFLSEIAGSDNNIEQRILAANPILEAFGNAKTIRNDNSSRFGRFMEIHFSEVDCKIVGCHTVNYLLEKSRVVDQAGDERNFHVFHYLRKQFSPEAREKYLIKDSETYNYLQQEEELHDDAKECSKMHQALEEMGFSENECDAMFRVVAGILHLGNVEFEESGSTGSKVKASSQKHLEGFCQLLGVDETRLAEALTMHVSQQRDGLLTRAFNTKLAGDARNALARHLYNRLFEYIIKCINKALLINPDAGMVRTRSNRNLNAAKASKTTFIGLLDIFGFEIFEMNSFEQLCINFANEKLQQMFNRHTFTLEEQTYIEERVPFDKIEFHDSQPLLSFLGLGASGGPPVRDGVLQLLDEQTAINGTDEKFLQQVVSRHNMKRKLFSDRCKSRTAFIVFHYAGAVEYETGGFVFKNADKLFENLETTMAASTSEKIKTIFSSVSASSTLAKTQAATFMKQLTQLEERTNLTFPRYIRCIKPNSIKSPGVFDAPSCLEQLRYAGAFEAVSIRKRGYPFRKTHKGFFTTYRCVEPMAVSRKDWAAAQQASNFRKVAELLLEGMVGRSVPSARDCSFGKSMVLYRAEQHRALEIQRLSVLNRAAAEIQKIMRGAYVRMHVIELRKARKQLQAAIKSRKGADLDAAIASSQNLFYKIKEAYDAEYVKEAIRLELSLEPKIASLRAKSDNADSCFDDSIFNELDSICSQMQKFMKRDKMAFQGNKDAKMLLTRYESFKIHRSLTNELKLVLDAVQKHTAAASLTRLVMLMESPRGGKLPTKLQSFLDESAKLRKDLEREIELAKNCETACSGCAVRAGAENIDVSATQANLVSLEQAYSAFVAQEPISMDGKDAAKRIQWSLQLYKALHHAMQTANHADDPEWVEVEKLLGSGQSILSNENEMFLFDKGQLSLISGELALRAQVDAIIRKLGEGIQAVNDEPLAPALEQAHALNLGDHSDAEIRDVVAEAEYLLPKIRQTRSALTSAVQAVNEQQLYDALVLQGECGFGEIEGMIGFESVQQARTLYTWVQNLTREARIAVKALEMEPTKIVVQGCEEIGLEIEELVILREFLALPRDTQLLRQREAAVALQSYKRAVNLSIAHKDLLFDNESSNNFALEHFPKLKTPEEFAKRFGITFSKYKGNMLHWYNPMFGKIHTSLTTIEPNLHTPAGKSLQKAATQLFKNVFGIMGDKIYENVDSLVTDLLSTGITVPDLVDEIYCQVMKQVTENPKFESETRGWNLMSILLATFPPSSQLENYLEYFLRRSGRLSCVRTLHYVLLCGPLVTPPSITEVAAERDPSNFDVWFEGRRTQLSLTKEQLKPPAQPDQVAFDWKSEGQSQQTAEVSHEAAPRDRTSMMQAPLAPGVVPEPGPPPPPPKKRDSSKSRLSAQNSSDVLDVPPPPPPPPPPKKVPTQSSQNKGPPPPPPPKRPSYDSADSSDLI